uniref:RING-type domain-containing protein n=1 Tax=Macrostomum lignano TaxID=282301 RepID=A0A1I8HNF3_9PLAT
MDAVSQMEPPSESQSKSEFEAATSLVPANQFKPNDSEEYIPDCEPNGITSKNLWSLELHKKLQCNMLNCNYIIHDEGWVLPCGHVFCSPHSPWAAGRTSRSPTGYQCALCCIPIEVDSEEYLFSSRLNMRGEELALVGVQPKEMVSWLRQSVNVWQNQSQLVQALKTAKATHEAKQRQIEQTRAKTAEMIHSISELKIYLGNKEIEEAQLKGQGERVRQRLEVAEKVKDEAKQQLEDLKIQMAREQQYNAELSARLAKADKKGEELSTAIHQLNHRVVFARYEFEKKQKWENQAQQHGAGNSQRNKKKKQKQRKRNKKQHSSSHGNAGESGGTNYAELLAPLIAENTMGLYEHLRERSPEPPCFRLRRH